MHAHSRTISAILDSPFVSVIILNYNGVHHLRECLDSVLETNYPRFEVIFVDNNSSDSSVEFVLNKILPSWVTSKIPLKIVQSPSNLGFAGGSNLGLRYCKGSYVVFLNNDTKVHPNWIRELVKIMERNRSIGIAQPKILKYGTIDDIDSVGINLYLAGISATRVELNKSRYNVVHTIPAAHAGIAMFRKSMLEEIGGFDQDYFMMREDDDISLRTWLSGWRIVLVPQSIVYHKGGGSGVIRARIYYSRRNGIITMLKNYEIQNLLRYLPPTILIHLVRGFFTKNKGDYFFACIKAYAWIIRNLKVLRSKRRRVQRFRKVCDKELIAKQVLKRVTLTSFLKGF
jgi:GT2 family glycosyltransferase